MKFLQGLSNEKIPNEKVQELPSTSNKKVFYDYKNEKNPSLPTYIHTSVPNVSTISYLPNSKENLVIIDDYDDNSDDDDDDDGVGNNDDGDDDDDNYDDVDDDDDSDGDNDDGDDDDNYDDVDDDDDVNVDVDDDDYDDDDDNDGIDEDGTVVTRSTGGRKIHFNLKREILSDNLRREIVSDNNGIIRIKRVVDTGNTATIPEDIVPSFSQSKYQRPTTR